MIHCHVDFESRSLKDLTEVGIDVYSNDTSTQAILLAWAIDDEPVSIVSLLRDSLPNRLLEAVHNPDVIMVAWNSMFERHIFAKCLGIVIPIERWHDPRITARFASIPGSLEECGKILNLPLEQRKLKEGHDLIQLFSMPYRTGGEETLFGIQPAEFHDWNDRPEEWSRFEEYCKQDVACERFIMKALRGFKLPEKEIRGWWLDQRINDRGLKIGLDLVGNALKLAEKEKEDILSNLSEKTGLANPNSNPQMLAWIKERGYVFSSMGKAFVARALAGESPLTPECKEVLELRQLSSRTSYTKYINIQNRTGLDGRLRDQFSFLGSSRAGRWASLGGAQLHNLPRPTKEVSKNMDLAVDLLRKGNFEEIRSKFSDPMALAVSCVRCAIVADKDKNLVVADYGAVENRVLGWVARCDGILKVFRDNLDPYVSFGTFMHGKSYEELDPEAKGITEEEKAARKEKRQEAKPAVLGAGYRLGGGQLGTDKFGNEIRTGLWGYSKAMGVDLPQEECERIVAVFRAAYPEVCHLWYDLENASFDCLDGGKHEAGRCVFEAFGGVDRFDRKLMRITLPSGRGLHYIRPRVESREFFGKPKKTLVYEGIHQQTRNWEPTTTHGGKLTENIVQGIARDLLMEAMLAAEEEGYFIVAHVHDEIVCEEKELGLEGLIKIMIKPPDWGQDLPLSAEGYISKYYKKG